MKVGPEPDRARRGPYLPPRLRKARTTLYRPLPDGVRIGKGITGVPHHEMLGTDGQWRSCSGRGLCKYCNLEEWAMTTIDRLREALIDHFGYLHMRTIGVDEDLFGADQNSGSDRKLGDALDRAEMLCCLDNEFDLEMPDDAAEGVVTLNGLAERVEKLRAEKRSAR